MPILNGVAATKKINANSPHIKILVLTTFDDDEYVQTALKNGAMGYLLKDTPSEELTVAIRAVYKRYTQLGPEFLKNLINQFTIPRHSQSSVSNSLLELNPRVKEVLRLIAMGDSNK